MWILSSLGSVVSGLIGRFTKQFVVIGLVALGVLAIYTAGGDAQRVRQAERDAAAERAAKRDLIVRVEQQQSRIQELQKEHEAIDEMQITAVGAGADCPVDPDFVRSVLQSYDEAGTS